MWAEYAQNSLQKPSTGLTPFQCVMGFHPPLFPWLGGTLCQWLAPKKWKHLESGSHPLATCRQETKIAGRSSPTQGQWVWLPTQDLRLRLPCKKISLRYVGPFQIIKQFTPVSFCLALPSNYRISPTFHASLLKPAGGPRAEEEEQTSGRGPPPILVDGEEAYQVQDLHESRHRGKLLQYLVDWEGYGPDERSWVNAEDILDPTLLTEFYRMHLEKLSQTRLWQFLLIATRGIPLLNIKPLWTTFPSHVPVTVYSCTWLWLSVIDLLSLCWLPLFI